MNDTAAFWSGDFGDEYLLRNRVDWRARIPFWKYIMDKTGARSVYEVGCNAGWNLSAIRRSYPDVALYGHDINYKAAVQAGLCGIPVSNSPARMVGATYELIFTAGVLIHIAPDELREFMQAIVDASSDYVLAIEYHSDSEQEVEYRGHAGKLWKRNYGKLYEELGLIPVEYGEAVGFDSCCYYLLRKA